MYVIKDEFDQIYKNYIDIISNGSDPEPTWP